MKERRLRPGRSFLPPPASSSDLPSTHVDEDNASHPRRVPGGKREVRCDLRGQGAFRSFDSCGGRFDEEAVQSTKRVVEQCSDVQWRKADLPDPFLPHCFDLFLPPSPSLDFPDVCNTPSSPLLPSMHRRGRYHSLPAKKLRFWGAWMRDLTLSPPRGSRREMLVRGFPSSTGLY
jgi:hypothetical protein